MGWAIGYVGGRDVGYGVPAECDLPKCHQQIDRGLSYICGSDIGGGEYGCGLFFCDEHMRYRKPHGSEHDVQLCPRCYQYRSWYDPKPDVEEWVHWKLTHNSWDTWRLEQPVGALLDMQARVEAVGAHDHDWGDENDG